MTRITPIEQHALDAIDLNGLLERLSELISYQSLGGNETPIQERMAAIMTSLGLEVDRWEIDLDALRKHPAYTAEIERESALGVVGRMGGADNAPTLILNGHIDVVEAGDEALWSVPPWEAKMTQDRVYGRGSADMKGGLCCALYALKAIRDARINLMGDVLVHSVVGEEDGGVGTLAAIERGHTGDGAIVLEPTELMIAHAQAGALNFRLIVPGKAAHGALRSEGVSPFDKYVPLYNAIRDFEAQRNDALDDQLFADYEIPLAICIGKVWSGSWPSTEAESLTCEGRIGIGCDEEPEDVRQAFGALIHETAQRDPWLREHPPILEWWGAQFEPAKINLADPIVRTLQSAHTDITGNAPTMRGMPYGADMRLLVNNGHTPAVIYGPGDVRRAHAPDEYVPIRDLKVATRALVLSILRFCGTVA